jgi:uncharacterized membrane protein
VNQPNSMPVSCPDCAAEMPELAAFCPNCGRTMQPEPETETVIRAHGKVGPLSENFAGALAYFTFVPAALFLVWKPFNRNRFVRFHSIQCLLFWLAGFAAAAVLKLATLALFFVPVVGPLFVLLSSMVVGLAAAFVWLVLVIKAFQGEMFKLPVLGAFADEKAAAV